MKTFTTAVEDVAEPKSADEPDLEFMLDDKQIKCWRPGDGQIAMLMASLGRHSNNSTRIAGIIDFIVGVMDEPSHEYITDRLMDRKDQFGLEEIQEIVEWLTEEWTARPTQPPSDSTQSQKSAGPKSTPAISK